MFSLREGGGSSQGGLLDLANQGSGGGSLSGGSDNSELHGLLLLKCLENADLDLRVSLGLSDQTLEELSLRVEDDFPFLLLLLVVERQDSILINIEYVYPSFGDDWDLDVVASWDNILVPLLGEDVLAHEEDLGVAMLAAFAPGGLDNLAREALEHAH